MPAVQMRGLQTGPWWTGRQQWHSQPYVGTIIYFHTMMHAPKYLLQAVTSDHLGAGLSGFFRVHIDPTPSFPLRRHCRSQCWEEADAQEAGCQRQDFQHRAQRHHVLCQSLYGNRDPAPGTHGISAPTILATLTKIAHQERELVLRGHTYCCLQQRLLKAAVAIILCCQCKVPPGDYAEMGQREQAVRASYLCACRLLTILAGAARMGAPCGATWLRRLASPSADPGTAWRASCGSTTYQRYV